MKHINSEALYLCIDIEKFQEFVLKFARFESALKAAGFFKRDRKSKSNRKFKGALPNWVAFAPSVTAMFQSL